MLKQHVRFSESRCETIGEVALGLQRDSTGFEISRSSETCADAGLRQ
jgi:hypothetical protein